MSWLNRITAPADPQHDLARRLRRLERLFEVDKIRGETLDPQRVQAYYRECHDAYRKHHSTEGAVHMALNDDGRFDPDGFAGQMRRLEATWGARQPQAVLELGPGQGYNLAWLAPRHPAVRFEGLDLSPDHLQIARRRLAPHGHVTLHQGNMHALPQADASVDEVFAVEAFCYASDLPRALSEVRRVLRPGGRFQLFDAYLTRPMHQMNADGAAAVDLVGRGTAVQRWQVVGELLAEAERSGFVKEAVVPLDAEVLPSLRRLERICGAIIRVPWLARRALARRAPERSRNVMTGYLLHRTVAMGLMCYRHIVWVKPA